MELTGRHYQLDDLMVVSSTTVAVAMGTDAMPARSETTVIQHTPFHGDSKWLARLLNLHMKGASDDRTRL